MVRIIHFFVVIMSFYLIGCPAEDVGQLGFMPMVAFLCRRPAMHLTGAGWMKDEQIDCLNDPKDILEYCKHVYPSLDVRYVVEASDVVRISNWCRPGRERCTRHMHSVRPFRCLVKPFISDALLVPKNCIFDHIHESSQCKAYSEWDITAGSSCTERGMFLKSFAMIQPCDVNKFAGTEFVCCPGNYNEDAKKMAGEIMVVDKNFERSRQNDKSVKSLLNSSETAKSNNKDVVARKTTEEHFNQGHKRHVKKLPKPVNKPKYVSAGTGNKNRLTTPQPSSQNVSKNITAEKHTMMSGDQKEVALENYLKSLNEEPISVARVLSTLKKYIKMQQKERMQTVESFKDRRASVGIGNGALVQVEKRLKELDQATEEALQMLEKIPKHGKKMRQHMDDYIHNLPSIDDSILRGTTPSLTPSGHAIHTSAGFHFSPDRNEMNTTRNPISSPLTSSSSTYTSSSKQLSGGREFDPIPAHMARNQLNVDQPHLKKIASKTNMAYIRHGEDKMTNPVGIILTSIGLVLIVVIGIVALIKRVNSVPVTNGYLDRQGKRVDGLRKSSMGGTGGSIRRQNSMNGYENPTYRYFEAHVNP